MKKTIKIFEDETNIYSGNCYVNSVIFRGRIYGDFKEVGQGGVKFSLQLSNGKKRRSAAANSHPEICENKKFDNTRLYYDIENSGEWNKPTFADCAAFGEVAKKILKGYKSKDEIWIIAKYYGKQHNGKFYKGFIVRDVISEKERVTAPDNSRFEYGEKGSNNAREASNSGAFYNDDLPF